MGDKRVYEHIHRRLRLLNVFIAKVSSLHFYSMKKNRFVMIVESLGICFWQTKSLICALD